MPLKRVDWRCINFYLWQTVPTVYGTLGEEMNTSITPAVARHQLSVVLSCCTVFDRVVKGSPWNCRQTFDHFEKFNLFSLSSWDRSPPPRRLWRLDSHAFGASLPKFGLLIDFDLLKAAILRNAKPEIPVVLSGRGGNLDKTTWRPNRSNTISGFAFVDIAAFRRSKFIWANQISSTYLNWWLRYSYFRFWKTTVRHIGNLLSVSISTICPKSAHYSAPGYRILSKSKIWRKYDVISIS